MIPFDLSPWIVFPILFLVGATLGRFLNVCVDRFPEHDRFRDQLTSLKWKSRWWHHDPKRNRILDSLPIFGWWWIVRRVKHGPTLIPWRYPILEFANGLILVLLYWFEVPIEPGSTIKDSSVYAAMGPQGTEGAMLFCPIGVVHLRFFFHAILIQFLLIATTIDLKYFIIPDGSTVPAMVVGIVGNFVLGNVFLVPVWYQDPSLNLLLTDLLPTWATPLLLTQKVPAWVTTSPHLHGLAVSLVGFCVGWSLVWVVRFVGQKILKQEAMGFGDVILMAMIGTFLGWQAVVMIFFFAPLCTILFVLFTTPFRFGTEIPYGPYLSLATLLILLFWQQFWNVGEYVFSWGPLIPVMAVVMIALMAGSLWLVQVLKWVLGIPRYVPQYEWIVVWSSAEQQMFLEGERMDLNRGSWPAEHWAGSRTSTGQAQLETWQHDSLSE